MVERAAALPPAVAAAYAHCERLAREHYENFPVASVLVPARMRPHIAAIYAFARTADDYADEPHRAPNERLRLLDDWEARLRDAARGLPRENPVFIALADTIRRCDIQAELLADLLSAFRQDVRVHRYATWDALFDYCRRSANPVGRLVLAVAGVREDAALLASDAVCTALQLANFWQDLGVDWRNGRLYVPAEEMRRSGAHEYALNGASLPPEWRETMRRCVERTRALFTQGYPVTQFVRGRLRWELRATWLGGVRILEKIEARQFDTLHDRPTLGAADGPLLFVRLLGSSLR